MRKLQLTKETLRRLNTGQMRKAGGGELTPDVATIPYFQCWTVGQLAVCAVAKPTYNCP